MIYINFGKQEKAFNLDWDEPVENYESYADVWVDIVQNCTDALICYRAVDLVKE